MGYKFYTFALLAIEEIYKTIKGTVLASLPGANVLLFGSRAKGTEDSQSDYDLMVITKQLFTQKEKMDWCCKMHKSIVKAIHAPVDLLLFSEDEIKQKRELPGHIVRSAINEGVYL